MYSSPFIPLIPQPAPDLGPSNVIFILQVFLAIGLSLVVVVNVGGGGGGG